MGNSNVRNQKNKITLFKMNESNIKFDINNSFKSNINIEQTMGFLNNLEISLW